MPTDSVRSRMKGRARQLGGLLLITLLPTGGCIPHVHEVTSHSPHPDADRKPFHTVESRKPSVMVSASVKSDLITVRVKRVTECRDITHTPTVVDTETKRTLENGTVAQGTNLVVGAGLTIGGVALATSSVSSCTVTPDATAANPKPASRACTADEVKKENNTRVGFGTVLITGGLIVGGVFVYNLIRSADTTMSEKSADRVTEGEWKDCGSSPLSKTAIALRIGDSETGRITAKTNAKGVATFDLAAAAATTIDADHAPPSEASIEIDDEQRATISIKGTSLFTAWQTQFEAKQAKDGHDAELAALEQVEGALNKLGIKPTWDEQQEKSYRSARATAAKISGSTFSKAEKSRLKAVNEKLAALQISYDLAVAAAKKKEEAEKAKALAAASAAAIPMGRKLTLSILKAPATASFVADAVILQCDSGWVITRHVVDAQNGFGALIRESFCPKFNPATGKAAVSLGKSGAELNMECSGPFGAALLSSWDCNRLEGSNTPASKPSTPSPPPKASTDACKDQCFDPQGNTPGLAACGKDTECQMRAYKKLKACQDACK